MNITKKIKEIVQPVIEEMGYAFVDMNYGRNGSKWLLQIFIYKDGGIAVADCQLISKQLNYELDRHPDILTHPYYLEISSPGLDRQLKTEADFRRNINEEVKIKLYDPIENNKIFTGKIINVDHRNIVIEDLSGLKRHVAIENINKANLRIRI